MTLDQALVAAVVVLAGAIGALWWKQVEAQRQCESDRRDLWAFILSQNSRTCGVTGCAEREMDAAPVFPLKRKTIGGRR